MTFSDIHLTLSENNPKVLSHPKEFLGSNYQAVLVFWSFIDTLNKEDKKKIHKLIIDSSDNNTRHAAEQIASWEYERIMGDDILDIWEAVYQKINPETIASDHCYLDAVEYSYATYELILDLPNKIFYDTIMSYKNP